MKRIVSLLSSLVFSAAALAADRPLTFVDVPWGASMKEAAAILAKRPGVTVLEAARPRANEDPAETAKRLEATGGEFADKPVSGWHLHFEGNKLYRGTVVIKTRLNSGTLYREFRQVLITKYGPPTRMKNDSADWSFPPSLKDKHTRTIHLELKPSRYAETEPVLYIAYTDETLLLEAKNNPAPSKPAPAKPAPATAPATGGEKKPATPPAPPKKVNINGV